MIKYDFLIIGAGFFGATCARLLTNNGYKCLIIEKENHVGGLAATQTINDIDIHMYGGHVIHTDDQDVWEFLQGYGNIVDYKLNIKSQYNNEYFQLPLNMNLLNKIYKVNYPKEGLEKIEEDRKNYGVMYRRNLEEEFIYQIGFKPYMFTLKNYYEKMFGLECKNLSIAYTRDIRCDLTYDTNYYSNKFCGVPIEGYTKMVENIIGDDIDIMLNQDFIKNKDKFLKLGAIIISSIPIDRFCNYVYGPLDWGTMKYELKDFSKETSNKFGAPIIRINDKDNIMLEMIEHKWLNPQKDTEEFNTHTYVSYVFPDTWTPDKECLFAINSEDSEKLLNKYIDFVNENYPNLIFGGRQGLYRNLSIADTVRLAIDLVNDIINANSSN